MSHLESTISVEQCALRASSAARDVALDDPLATRRSARGRRRPAPPPGARAAPSSTRSPGAAGACAAGRRCRPAGTPGRRARAACRSRRASCPAASETIVRSAPIERVEQRRLADVRPPEDRDPDRRVARRSRRASPRSDSRSTITSSRSPVPWPCIPESGQRVAEPEPMELERRALLRRGRRPCWRSRAPACRLRGRSSASSSSPGVTPARASATSSTRSASAIAARACSTIERTIASALAMSTPPVSISRKRLPAQSHTSSLRSRVVPLVSCTTAARVAVSRLISVDLPTLGKPTIATVPRRSSRSPPAASGVAGSARSQRRHLARAGGRGRAPRRASRRGR